LLFVDATGAEPDATKEKSASVAWESAPSKEVSASPATSGLRVARNPETGELRAPVPGELPAEKGQGRRSEIVKTPTGTWLIVGDDLMSDAVATKRADGTLDLGCGQGDGTSTAGHHDTEEE
jgi:hypothetical protein